MKIIKAGASLELHILSSVTDNTVKINDVSYEYKRLVIPKVIMDYFSVNGSVNGGTVNYLYLYFHDHHVYLSEKKIQNMKFSRRKVMKISNNSFCINLNPHSLKKYDIQIGDNVLFKVYAESVIDEDDVIGIELKFS